MFATILNVHTLGIDLFNFFHLILSPVAMSQYQWLHKKHPRNADSSQRHNESLNSSLKEKMGSHISNGNFYSILILITILIAIDNHLTVNFFKIDKVQQAYCITLLYYVILHL